MTAAKSRPLSEEQWEARLIESGLLPDPRQDETLCETSTPSTDQTVVRMLVECQQRIIGLARELDYATALNVSLREQMREAVTGRARARRVAGALAAWLDPETSDRPSAEQIRAVLASIL